MQNYYFSQFFSSAESYDDFFSIKILMPSPYLKNTNSSESLYLYIYEYSLTYKYSDWLGQQWPESNESASTIGLKACKSVKIFIENFSKNNEVILNA